MHRLFGTKENVQYYDREGAYLIPVKGNLVGVVRLPRGYFLLGGGVESGESHKECIERECMEEAGYRVSVGDKVCSAEKYCYYESTGFFHPIQNYYFGTLLSKEAEPIETDHEFMWIEYSEIKGKMFSEMQDWALEMALGQRES